MKIIKLYALGLLLISSFNVLGTTCNIIDSQPSNPPILSVHQFFRIHLKVILQPVNVDQGMSLAPLSLREK
ncbi:hypothetical protein BSPWISOXPB_2426 [uncultured Gammaproteobacteria bacterium]|nr:hypothetical protein BSPWISOXPB_2426 [uncultured Gammaproteobacteria bacterium]